MSATLGIIDLGQTPDPGFREELARAAPGTHILSEALLQDFTDAQVIALDDPEGVFPIHFPLPGGGRVSIPLAHFLPRAQAAVDRLVVAGADVVVITCAGDFSSVRCSVPLVLPGRLSAAVVAAVLPGAAVAAVMPTAGQVAPSVTKWTALGLQPQVRWRVPAGEDPSAERGWRQLAQEFVALQTAVTVLDCMGFDHRDAAVLRALTDRPVIVARELAVQVCASLLRGGGIDAPSALGQLSLA
ncbi:AroM family protein [Kineococcus sp. SYSU DK006]|uniref:AroM family protein n=1 Tax=Kineococcus sp. SYSU DK006 TaxID=3383127 RepID=UPI003D7DFF59